MRQTFADRLRWVMNRGNLTGADLARWFDRPDPTVRSWLNGINIRGAAMDVAYIEGLLDKLERLIKAGTALPVPHMARQERLKYLAELRAKVLPRRS